MPVDDLTIVTGGVTLGGWTRFSLAQGVELLPSYCQVDLTEKAPTQINQAVVTPFSACEVYLGSDLALTGYIDIYQPQIDAETHAVTIVCRSKCEDVVDCAVDVTQLKTWTIAAGTLGQAARMLVKPYEIDVVLPDGDVPLNPQYPVAIRPGETVYHVLENLARQTQMLIYDDPQGRLVLAKAHTTRAGSPLVEGVNVKIGAARISGDQRYSHVIALGSYFLRDSNGISMTLTAEGFDTSVPRNRLLMIPMDLPGPNKVFLQNRVNWEISRRYGRSRTTRATVVGWRDAAGALWQPNTVTNVQAPSLKVGEDMSIAHVTFRRDGERGTTTELLCMPTSGLQPAPFTAKPLVQLTPTGT